jgi:hypothetical protein
MNKKIKSILIKYKIVKNIIKVSLIAAVLLLINVFYKPDIYNCHKITKGKVKKVCYHQGWDGLEYEYEIHGKKFRDVYSDLHIKKLVGVEFPVIYDCSDSSYSYMLIYPEDFKKFGYKFPDSLKWILPIIK